MTDSSIPQLTRRQFLGAAASVGVWSSVGTRLPVGATFAPAFFNCDVQFFSQVGKLLLEKPNLRLTLFLTVDELQWSQGFSSRQVEIGFRPNSPHISLDYAKWKFLHQKPLFVTAEQGALWPKLATLCAEEEILLASWDGVSEQFIAGNQTPLFDGSRVDLKQLFDGIDRTGFLVRGWRGSAEKITPLQAPH